MHAPVSSRRVAPVVGAALAALALPGIALVGGCGGATSSATASQNRTTRATVTLAWPDPAPTRLVPVASHSVRITISGPDNFQVSQVIARPSTSATFANLPPGALTIAASAHPDTAGTVLPAQASGTQVVQARADEPFAIRLTLDSTIDHVDLTPALGTIASGEVVSLAATARDAAGNLVLTGSGTWTWSNSNTAVADIVPNGAGARLTGIAGGNTVLQVTETESGKSATRALSVTAPPDPFAGTREYLNLDPNQPENYADPAWPVHYDANVLARDNTPPGNPVTNRGATLGRVLFYDKRLSVNDTVSCASCHQQGDGFVEERRFSLGFDGVSQTDAHAMRLGNVRFFGGGRMFWDKRAASVEAQATQPIQNAVEMGFDEAHGGFAALAAKMEGLSYYPELFRWAFGDTAITEDRVQRALAQFERAMVSVHSAFDTGFARVYDPTTPQAGVGRPFPNYTAQEERGKQLFLAPPNQAGAGCVTCHTIPTFALDPNSRSNGLDAGETRLFKSPSLKNIAATGPYMHDGRFATLEQVVDHYIRGVQDGPALDNRLKGPGGQPQRLNLTVADRDALVAFLKTLTDPSLNGDPKFANPFRK